MSLLVPIRIDVFSKDKAIRIVDTLLIDTSVWPKPIVTNEGPTLQEQSLSDNARCYAASVLGDSEVSGISSGKHSLWSEDLLQRIHDNILPQLRAAFNMRRKQTRSASIGQSETVGKDFSKRLAEGTVPVRIRMSLHGIRIHDDWFWDPMSGPEMNFNEISMAEQVCADLKLSAEAGPALAIACAEQARGMVLPGDPSKHETDEGGPNQRVNATAAWVLEQRVHVTNVAHLVAHHRK